MKNNSKKMSFLVISLILILTTGALADSNDWMDLGYDNSKWVQDSSVVEFMVKDEGGSKVKDLKRVDEDGKDIVDNGITFNPSSGIGKFTATNNGIYYFIATDNATNETRGKMVVKNIDSNVPKIDLKADNLKPTNKPVNITAIFTDIEGIKTITMPDLSIISGDGLKEISKTFKALESKKYTFKVEDISGRITTKDIEVNNIKVGDIKINIEDYNKEWNNKAVTITANAKDSNGKTMESQTKSFETEGEHTFSFTFTDEWGNTATSTGIVKIDMTNPTMTISISSK